MSDTRSYTKTRTLVECALLIAMAAILEMVSKLIGLELPFGGTITLASMLPIVMISYRHGLKWGFLSGFAYSLIQMLLGVKVVSAMFLPGDDQMIFWQAICVCILDYVLAYTVLGIGGIFRNKLKPTAAILCGILLALCLRYLIHIVSGAIFYGAWAEWFFTQDGFYSIGAKILEKFSGTGLAVIYSIFYNGLYMIPEIIITSIVGVIISRFPEITGEKKVH